MHWSNRVYNGTGGASTVTVSLESIITGDESLYLKYSSNEAFPDPKELVVFSNSSAIVAAANIQSFITGSTLLSDENEFSIDDNGATFQLKDLANNTTYNLAIGFVDKYQFGSFVTATSVGTPLEIAEFLNEQSCYLVSAGFGRPHYVLEYFRMIRDDYLLQTRLGSLFVYFYYGTAPQ